MDLPMPSHVKAFWWLSVVMVAYWGVSTVWPLIFPSTSHLALLARLPQHDVNRVHIINAIGVALTLVFCGATLGTAWLAAARRKNWARWVSAALLLHNPIAISLGMALIPGPLHPRLTDMLFVAHLFWAGLLRVTPQSSFPAIFVGVACTWFG